MIQIFEKYKNVLIRSRIWKSVFRRGMVDSNLRRSEVIMTNVFLHLHPVKVRKDSVSYWYTLGLGGISFLLFIILTVTGILLAFYYIPSTKLAYQSIKDIENVVSYGSILRNMHRWAAHGMVVTVFLHMCRVFFTYAYCKPREFNWVVGVSLFLMTIGFSFTGYLLPWDQLAFWAITVGTNMATYAPIIGEEIRYFLLGGNVVSQGALSRFYVLHCFVIPGFMIIALIVHFWRIRKDGGISGPTLAAEPEKLSVSESPTKTYGLMEALPGSDITSEKIPDNYIFTWTHLLPKELLATIIVICILNIVSVYFSAPLEELANPTVTPNPAKAPWYFLGLQELVHYSAFVGGVLIPFLIVVGLMVIPYIDFKGKGLGVWFSPQRKVQNSIFGAFVIIMTILIIIGTFFRGENWQFVLPW